MRRGVYTVRRMGDNHSSREAPDDRIKENEMNATITVVRNNRGDFEAHIGGCADLGKKTYRQSADGHQAESYKGATLAEAIIACDTDWASAFGYEWPVSEEESSEVWSITYGTIRTMPCLHTAIAAEAPKVAAPDVSGFGHKVRWFATDINLGTRTLRTGKERGGHFLWDAECSCGFDSAPPKVFAKVRKIVNEHKAVAA